MDAARCLTRNPHPPRHLRGMRPSGAALATFAASATGLALLLTCPTAVAQHDPATKTQILSAALSNQAHQGLRPYRMALTGRYGAAFVQAHFGGEGRRVCWSETGTTECAYARFQDLNQAPELRLSDLVDTVRNPCRWIDEVGVRAARPGFFAKASREQAEAALRHHIRPLDECVAYVRHEGFRIVPTGPGAFEVEMVMRGAQ